jgi:hypothetical protein
VNRYVSVLRDGIGSCAELFVTKGGSVAVNITLNPIDHVIFVYK